MKPKSPCTRKAALRIATRRTQAGLSIAYLLAMIALAVLVGAFLTKSAPSSSSLRGTQALTAAAHIHRAAQGLAERLVSLKLTVGAAIDPQILDGNYITSVSSQWTPVLVDPLAGSDAISSWSLVPTDTLTVPNTTTKVKVATLEVTPDVCGAVNRMELKPGADGAITAPLLAATGNGSGGTDYTVTNLPAFNQGLATDLFCVAGAGSQGNGRVFLGLLTD